MEFSDPLTVGQLYKAISSDELVEVEPTAPCPGLKLMIDPEQVKILRGLQKILRERLGDKPEFSRLLNAMIAVVVWESHVDELSKWLEDNSSKNSSCDLRRK